MSVRTIAVLTLFLVVGPYEADAGAGGVRRPGRREEEEEEGREEQRFRRSVEDGIHALKWTIGTRARRTRTRTASQSVEEGRSDTGDRRRNVGVHG